MACSPGGTLGKRNLPNASVVLWKVKNRRVSGSSGIRGLKATVSLGAGLLPIIKIPSTLPQGARVMREEP